MGIMVPIVRIVLKEHKRKPITGDGLLIGRQTVPLTVAEARAMIREEGIPLRDVEPALDTTTVASRGKNFISDIGFFSLFSDVRLRTLDVHDYEGAEIIHDMHYPVPDELASSFDFIWQGSCLDNMFDPAQAMRSTTRMLRPGGRMVCMESAGSPYYNEYVMFSHVWFHDYFAINNFAYAKVYSCIFHPDDIWDGPFDVYAPADYEAASHKFPLCDFRKKAIISVSIAEASKDTTSDKMPLQFRFETGIYKEAFDRFSKAPPMITTFSTRKLSTGQFQYLGRLRAIPGRRFPEHTRLGQLKRMIQIATSDPGRVLKKLRSA